MSKVTVDVCTDVLNWMIEQLESNDTNDSILESLHTWALGKEKPTVKQLEDVSNKTHIPFGYFFLMSPPDEDFCFADYRTVGSNSIVTPSRNLLDTIDTMRRVQDWMTEYKALNNIESPIFINKFNYNSSIDKIIQDIRNVLELEIDWFVACSNSKEAFKYFRLKLENSGVLVLQNGVVGSNNKRKLNINEFRAFCINDNTTPLIFINSNDSDNGKFFSIVHETAHLWMGEENFFHDKIQSNNREIEKKCNKIASEIIVPEKIFIEKWKTDNTEVEEKISKLAKFFRCSTQVIVRRAADFRFISYNYYSEFVKKIEKAIESKTSISSGGGDYYKTQKTRWGRPLLLALAESTRNGKTLYRDAYRLTGMKGKSFHTLVDMIESVS